MESSLTARRALDLSDSVSEINQINDWVSSIRKKIEAMLKEERPSYEAIRVLLTESLFDLKTFIQPMLNHYQALMDASRQGIRSREGLGKLKFLEEQLGVITRFFRSSILLFHPDKSYGDEHIRLIKTELFKEFRQFSEDSVEHLGRCLQQLKRCIPKITLDFDKWIEKMEREREAFSQWLRAEHAEINAQHDRIRKGITELSTQHAELSAQHDETRAENAEMRARQKLMEAQISALMRAHHPSHTEEVRDTACSRGFFRP